MTISPHKTQLLNDNPKLHASAYLWLHFDFNIFKAVSTFYSMICNSILYSNFVSKVITCGSECFYVQYCTNSDAKLKHPFHQDFTVDIAYDRFKVFNFFIDAISYKIHNFLVFPLCIYQWRNKRLRRCETTPPLLRIIDSTVKFCKSNYKNALLSS